MAQAVGLERISTIVGYILTKGNFSETSPNLPISISILGEANTDNQSSLNTDPKEITSAKQAGQLYGYGSPIYQIMRILRPVNGGGTIGGIPTIVYPQAQAVGATSKQISVTVAGTATANGTHTIYIAGRAGVDGQYYDVNISTGDTGDVVAQKITDAVNAVLGSPVIATVGTYDTVLETKWKGLTANALTVSVDTGVNDLGLTYALNVDQAGSGTPSVQAALDAFGSRWNNIVVNSYGTQSTVVSALEDFNGIPSDIPTGRYAGIVFKPFIALTGSVADNEATFTDAHKDDCTIAICSAPLSAGFPFEAAANYCALFARVSQDNPELDVQDKKLPDMPTPISIGTMADYENRDLYVKKGCTTIDLSAGSYVIKDFVTTYHPDGEIPAQFAYCRNLILDFNVRYGYYLLEQKFVLGSVIANDNDTVLVQKVIRPKDWKQVLYGYFDELVNRGLIVDSQFSKDSLVVNISTSNPNRLETFFRYKRSGFARISSTVAEAGFNFGTLNI